MGLRLLLVWVVHVIVFRPCGGGGAGPWLVRIVLLIIVIRLLVRGLGVWVIGSAIL
jgi:hypothetical protein